MDTVRSFIKEMLFPPKRPAGTPVGLSEVGRSFSTPEGKQLTASPTAGLSAGESCTLKRIIILKLRLNQHSDKASVADGGLTVGLSSADFYESRSSDYLLVCFKK
ncbi:hypothetical protein C6Y45_11600 [Alkalicoccus saliphilus]|uniref:Uncharacterized protein n=1 Tax=Alkalicoccus saliphilus TaxID=200989 RepID=A0A2T4U4S3_9BACI|nr:hypothetical protein C6Y45_11600 [Alkalicoccus saliphilus]